MSVPPQYAAATTSATTKSPTTPSSTPTSSTNAEMMCQPVEDCRDYLRTGRCKYGASCKYNHPPNVASGGGMKVPLDPTEPPFPIRPDEPVCSYYMKHGTCKFGQTCKYHHPPQQQQQQQQLHHPNTTFVTPVFVTTTTAPLNGSSSKGPRAANATAASSSGASKETTHLILNSSNAVMATTSTTQQLMILPLPQRPDEEDCKYFLKHGRCNYGASCRYHHPISRLRLEDSRSNSHHGSIRLQPQQHHYQEHQRVSTAPTEATYLAGSRVHFTSTTTAPSQATAGPPPGYHHHRSGQQATNVPVTFVSMDPNLSQTSAFQPIPVVTTSDGLRDFCLPTQVTEQGSANSSIASSYDSSSLELHLAGTTGSTNAAAAAEHQQRQEQYGVWTRAKRSGSTNSLSTHHTVDSARTQARSSSVFTPSVISEGGGSIGSWRNRAASLGSASENSYSVGGYGGGGGLDGSNNSASLNGTSPIGSWARSDQRSSSFDQTSSSRLCTSRPPAESYHHPQLYVDHHHGVSNNNPVNNVHNGNNNIHQEVLVMDNTQPSRTASRRPTNHHHPPLHHYHNPHHAVSSGMHRRLPPSQRRTTNSAAATMGYGGVEGEDGLILMTTSLLNMLDTTEEALFEGYSDDDIRYSTTPPQGNNQFSRQDQLQEAQARYRYSHDHFDPGNDLHRSAVSLQQDQQQQEGSRRLTSTTTSGPSAWTLERGLERESLVLSQVTRNSTPSSSSLRQQGQHQRHDIQHYRVSSPSPTTTGDPPNSTRLFIP